MDQDFIDSIITNIKIISMVQINEKLGIRKGHLQIDHSSNVQFLKRWFNRDSREIVLKFIKDLIKNIIIVMEKIENKSLLIDELIKLEPGFENLKITYSDDLVTIVTIELISMKVKRLIS
jgi:hypothetical protein